MRQFKSKSGGIDTLRLRVLHTACKTVEEIAREMGTSAEIVRLNLERLGYKPLYTPHKKEMPEYFEEIKKNKNIEGVVFMPGKKTSPETRGVLDAFDEALSEYKSLLQEAEAVKYKLEQWHELWREHFAKNEPPRGNGTSSKMST